VLCDVPREQASVLLTTLREHGVEQHGGIGLEPVETLGRRARRAERIAKGSSADAVVWEEVRLCTSEEATLSFSYLVFMTAAMIIAAVGILQDSPILIVGAMVVGPEFGPLAGFVVAVVQRRRVAALASLSALLVGFAVGLLVTYALTRVGHLVGLVHREVHSTNRLLTGFIARPDAFSFLIALIAGVAGHLSLTTAKSAPLVGVLVSVTTVPAAANIAVASSFGDWSDARGAAAQLSVNLVGLTLAGLATLGVQRLRFRHRQVEHDTAHHARGLLVAARTVAVVGASTDPAKAGYTIPRLLVDAGLRVIPVHPSATEIFGERAYRTLTDVPEPVDIVDVFRSAAEAPEIARQAIAIHAKALWLQLSISSPKARAIAREAGLAYVENRCIGRETVTLGLRHAPPGAGAPVPAGRGRGSGGR
jgi:uncharacterized hydrophobic protein (TIGR00271 family)